MSNKEKVFGILLFGSAVDELGVAITPYLRQGPVGDYIYCRSVVQEGAFMKLTIDPEQVDQGIECPMVLWIPTSFVKFVAVAEDEKSIGFSSYRDDL